jgi:hypothetical protein
MTVKMYEMFLLLPNFLFIPLAWILGTLPNANIISPGQLDIIEGRRTATSKALAELISV